MTTKQTKKILYDYCDEFIKILRAMEKEMHNLLKLNEEDLKETLRIVNDDLEKYEHLVSILQRRIMDPIDIEEEGEK